MSTYRTGTTNQEMHINCNIYRYGNDLVHVPVNVLFLSSLALVVARITKRLFSFAEHKRLPVVLPATR